MSSGSIGIKLTATGGTFAEAQLEPDHATEDERL